MTLAIPDQLIKAIRFARGADAGDLWLAELPGRISTFVDLWQLKPLAIATGGAMSCCVYCSDRDGRAVVLKIPFDIESGELESRSLAHWSRNRVAPQVLATDRTGVFLMTRVEPGLTAIPKNDPGDSIKFSHLVSRMSDPALGMLPGLRSIREVALMRLTWAQERFLVPQYEPVRALLPVAHTVLAGLMASTGENRVLHGDLQFKNILCGPGGQWQAIDPFTCIGDVNAEAALWAIAQADESTISQRIDELARSPLFTADRLYRWCHVFAIAEYRLAWPVNEIRLRGFLRGQSPDAMSSRKP